jgi:hypothetical protein
METNNKPIPKLSKRCFWDQDYTKLNFDSCKRYIIMRVVSNGSQDDHIELFNYYGWNIIKEEVVNIKYLNIKILNFLSVIFDIDKTNFRAYKNRGCF